MQEMMPLSGSSPASLLCPTPGKKMQGKTWQKDFTARRLGRGGSSVSEFFCHPVFLPWIRGHEVNGVI
jgi:hypothetical protein